MAEGVAVKVLVVAEAKVMVASAPVLAEITQVLAGYLVHPVEVQVLAVVVAE